MVPRPGIYPTIELAAGAAFFDNINVTDSVTGVPVDLTGYTNWKMQGRDGPTPQDNLIFDLGVTADTVLTVTDNPGNITYLVPGTLTSGWPEEVFFDMWVTDPSGNRIQCWKGQVLVTPGVTEQS